MCNIDKCRVGAQKIKVIYIIEARAFIIHKLHTGASNFFQAPIRLHVKVLHTVADIGVSFLPCQVACVRSVALPPLVSTGNATPGPGRPLIHHTCIKNTTELSKNT